jgi:hypothetical protein
MSRVMQNLQIDKTMWYFYVNLIALFAKRDSNYLQNIF